MLSIAKVSLFAHYVMIYGQIYGEIYDVPGISVHFDACSDSVYQALFSGLGTRLVSILFTVCTLHMVGPLWVLQLFRHPKYSILYAALMLFTFGSGQE